MSSHSSSKASDFRLVWISLPYDTFQVEIAKSGDDLIYHFWPPGQGQDFQAGFDLLLQEAFQYAFRNQPKDDGGFPNVDVRAGSTSLEDAKVMMSLEGVVPSKAILAEGEEVTPLATFHVKVIGWATNPMADQLLRDDLLARLDAQVKAHAPQEDDQPSQPDQLPERDSPRRRKRRGRKRK